MGFLSKIKENRSETSTLSNPAQWLVDMFSPQSSSGVSVTEESAMTHSAVYAAVRVIAETIASLPLNVYEDLGDQGKRKAKNNYLYPLLHKKPNNLMTSFTWRETAMAHLLLWGNHYSQLEIDSSGKIVGLWPLMPGQTQVKLRNRKLYYIYYDIDGKQKIYDQSEILHIPGLGFDGLVGKSVIRMAREAIGLGLAAEEFGAKFFSQGAQPGGIVEYPGTLSDEAYKRYKKDVRKEHQGLGNAHKIMVLEEGLSFHQTGIPPGDAQFLETRKFQVNEVARIFRVPPHMLGDLDRATFSNIEQQSIDFVVNTIRPWLVRIEQVLNDKLISSKNNKNYIKFVVEGLLRGDAESRSSYYNQMFQIGAMSPNDILEKEDMNPVPGGDQRFVPLNMIPLNSPDIPSGEDDRSSHKKKETRNIKSVRSAQARRNIALSYRRVIKKSAERVIKKETETVRKKAREELSNRNNVNLKKWLEDYYEEFPETVRKEMAPVLSSLAETIVEEAGKEVSLEDIKGLDEFLDEYIGSFAVRYSRYSRNQIKALIDEALDDGKDPLEAIEGRLDEWEERRPDKIAQEESVKGAGAFSKFAFSAAGITQLVWVTMGDDPCPYCQELDGKVVGIEQNFLGAGESLNPTAGDGPMEVSGNIGHAPLHQGCECGISPA